METRVQRWGNSLAVRIPEPIAAQLGLANHRLSTCSKVKVACQQATLVQPHAGWRASRSIWGRELFRLWTLLGLVSRLSGRGGRRA